MFVYFYALHSASAQLAYQTAQTAQSISSTTYIQTYMYLLLFVTIRYNFLLLLA